MDKDADLELDCGRNMLCNYPQQMGEWVSHVFTKPRQQQCLTCTRAHPLGLSHARAMLILQCGASLAFSCACMLIPLRVFMPSFSVFESSPTLSLSLSLSMTFSFHSLSPLFHPPALFFTPLICGPVFPPPSSISALPLFGQRLDETVLSLVTLHHVRVAESAHTRTHTCTQIHA